MPLFDEPQVALESLVECLALTPVSAAGAGLLIVVAAVLLVVVVLLLVVASAGGVRPALRKENQRRRRRRSVTVVISDHMKDGHHQKRANSERGTGHSDVTPRAPSNSRRRRCVAVAHHRVV